MATTTQQPSAVTETPPADPSRAEAHFAGLLQFETDCWDVHHALFAQAADDFVLLDVRSADAYASGHIDGAVNLPYRQIGDETVAVYPPGRTLVVYCWGPHCNSADKAAVRLARLGRPVKKMIGGIEGWKDEGFDLVPDGSGP